MEVFKKRRQNFSDNMNGGVAVIRAQTYRFKNRDVNYKFRQDSSFYYLTGFCEPDAILIICPQYQKFKSAIFVRASDPTAEQWSGRRLGAEKAATHLGIEKSFSLDQFDKIMAQIVAEQDSIYLNFFANDKLENRILEICKNAGRSSRTATGPRTVIHPETILEEMRLYKDESELELLKKAAEINTEAHLSTMKFIRPGMYEYEVQAHIESIYKKRGAHFQAYETIIASGNNANILHYVSNDAVLKQNDLVLIDAGPEYNYYPSDVTRTFPVNGKFSPAARDLYEIVLEAQLKAMAQIGPKENLMTLHEVAAKIIAQGLIDLKILKGTLEEVMEKKDYNKFYPHSLGHWIGLDVHDLGKYKSKNFAPGTCFSIEPGIYIPAENTEVAPQFKGIGIRIEDNIFITDDGYINLTEKIPKSIKELENIT